MSQKNSDYSNFSWKKVGIPQFVKFLDYLSKNGTEEEFSNVLLSFVHSITEKEIYDITQESIVRQIILHCLKACGHLFVKNHQTKAFDLLEFSRTIIMNIDSSEPIFDKLKTVIYNNIAMYCLSIEDNSMAVKFLQNCIKKDTGADPFLTCVLYNNLASIYLTHTNYEKAFKYSKKSLYHLEPEIFSLMKTKRSEYLRQDEIFKKKLLTLLVGYLNIASSLEGYQFRTSIPDPSREMLEMNPKNFYANSLKLAKKFLGEDHRLTQRFQYCYTKSEMVLFKEIVTSEDSDIERHRTPTKRRLKEMLENLEEEDTRPRMSRDHLSQNLQKHKNNAFKIRKGSYSRPYKPSQVDVSSSYESNSESAADDLVEYSKKGHVRTSSHTSLHSDVHQKFPLENNYLKSPSASISNFNPIDQAQLLQVNLQLMLQHQRELEEKLTKKIEENIKSLSRFDDNNDDKSSKSSGKPSPRNPVDELKQRKLELEIERLRQENQKILQMKVEKDIEVERLKVLISKNETTSPMSLVFPSYQDLDQIKPRTRSEIPDNFSEAIREDFSPPTNSASKRILTEPKKTVETRESDPITSTSINHERITNLINSSPQQMAHPEPKVEQVVQEMPKPKPLGKYAYKKDRNFKLDLSKVERKVLKEDEIRDRNAEEVTNNKGSFTKSPQLQGSPLPIPLQKTPAQRLGSLSQQSSQQSSQHSSAQNSPKEVAQKPNPFAILKPTQQQSNSNFLNVNIQGTLPNTPPIKGENRMDIRRNQLDPFFIPKETQTLGKPAPNNQHHLSPAMINVQMEKLKELTRSEKNNSNNSLEINKATSSNSSMNSETNKRTTKTEEEKSNVESEKLHTSPNQEDNMRDRRSSISMILPIPTSLDTLDSATPTNNSLGDKQKLPKYAKIKKRVFLNDSYKYTLVCSACWTQDDKSFKIQLMSAAVTNNDQFLLCEEELKYKELQKIVKHIEYKDIMPVNFQIKQIRNFYTFVRFLLIPFIGVVQVEENYKIEIWAKPAGLLNTLRKLNFMGRTCFMNFHHIIGNKFRIVLTETTKGEEVLRVDTDMDDSSIRANFEKSGGIEAELRSVKSIVKILEGFDDEADEDQVTDATNIMKGLKNPERVDEEELVNYQLKNEEFIHLIEKILTDMEAFFADKGMTRLSEVVDEKIIKYYKLNITNECKKVTFVALIDKPEKELIEVNIQNFFLSHAPHKKKVKASGHQVFQYDNMWKHFGINYQKLDPNDKISACYLLSHCYRLEVFDKGSDIHFEVNLTELQPEDFERYEENPIIWVPTETYAFHRSFLGEKYKFPLTLSFIGVQGMPLGLKATVYNLDNVSENGSFFHMNPTFWEKQPEEIKKKRTYKVATIAALEHYHLEYVLKKGGWEILKKSLVFDHNPAKTDIVGIRIMKGISHMEQLENILNSDSIFKYVEEKDANE